MIIFALLFAVTTTLEYEDLREVETRAAVSNELASAVAPLASTNDLAAVKSNLETQIANATPADYASVSNRAMSAVQTELDPTVPSWAKSESKPGYSYGEIAGTPTNVSAFTNDAGYLTEHQSLANYYTKGEVDTAVANATPDDYATVSNRAMTAVQTETDPTVSSWAKAATKPSYAYSEISGTPDLGVYATTGQVAQALSGKLGNTGDQTLDGMLVVNNLTVGKFYPVLVALEDLEGAYVTICGKWSFDGSLGSRISRQDGMDTKYVAFLSDLDLATNTLDTAISNRGYLTEHQSLTNYYTRSQTTTAITAATNELAQATAAALAGKAATNHTHTASDITDFAEAVAAVSPPSDFPGSYTHDLYPIATPIVSYTSKTAVTILGDIRLMVAGAQVYLPAAQTVTVADALAAGESITPGTDYFVHLTTATNIVVSTNATLAAARPIGGFHTICRSVSASLAMAPSSVFAGALHPLAGWTAGDILPKSVWALNFRPSCPDPTGMVYLREVDTWVDIYNGSGSIYAPESKFGGPRTHTKSQIAFMTGYGNVGKLLLNEEEFWFASLGSNVGTKVAGEAQPNPDTTGGHNDTAGYPMISAVGCEEMCGLQAQWLRDTHATNGGSWDNSSYPTVAYDGGNNSFGSNFYMSQYRAVGAGGNWTPGTDSAVGPLCRVARNSRSSVSVSLGGRGSSRSTCTYKEP